jgi:pimeloyl-ACP methyl ester carboxylesterase
LSFSGIQGKIPVDPENVRASERIEYLAAIGLGLFAAACAPHAPAGQVPPPGDRSPPPIAVDDAAAASDGSDGSDTQDGPEAGTPGDAGERAALGGFPEQFELVDGKDKIGVVSVPLGAREPRPIMIALHGGSEKPERACRAWRTITEAYPFVICPHGWGGNESRLGWANAADTNQRIARALAATKTAFGAWVEDTRSVVLAGFSMGGSQVPLVARRDPGTYRRIVVGDAAHDPRAALAFAGPWAAGGGERALFLCTTSGCEPSMRAAARKVARERATARLNIAPTQVHGLSERAAQSMRRDWAWLVEGAEGWERYAPPSEALPGKTEEFGP